MTKPALRNALKERGLSIKGNILLLKIRLIHAINEGLKVHNKTEPADVKTQSRKRKKSSSYITRAIDGERETNVTNIMRKDCHAKTEEKRSSMESHCNFLLALRNAKINSGELSGRIIPNFNELTFEYLNDRDVVGE